MRNDNNDATFAPALAPYNEKANAAIVKAVRARDWTKTAVRYGEICLTLAKPDEFTEVWSQLDLSTFPPDLNNMPWIGLYRFTGSGQRDAKLPACRRHRRVHQTGSAVSAAPGISHVLPVTVPGSAAVRLGPRIGASDGVPFSGQ